MLGFEKPTYLGSPSVSRQQDGEEGPSLPVAFGSGKPQFIVQARDMGGVVHGQTDYADRTRSSGDEPKLMQVLLDGSSVRTGYQSRPLRTACLKLAQQPFQLGKGAFVHPGHRIQ